MCNLPETSHRRVLLVCNHPLGGLDGMALIAWFSDYFGTQLQVVVNDLLMAVEPLSPCFVPVNKHGAQSRGTARSIDSAMASDAPVLMFPAGLVSRRGDDGVVADLSWNKMFLRKAVEYRRDVVPLEVLRRAQQRRILQGGKAQGTARPAFQSGNAFAATRGVRQPRQTLHYKMRASHRMAGTRARHSRRGGADKKNCLRTCLRALKQLWIE